MTATPTPRDSQGARWGQSGVSRALGANDPRPRRAAQADSTNAGDGAFVKRDELGRPTVDVDALANELVARGFVRQS